MALPIVNSNRYSVTVPSTGQVVDFRPFLVKEEKILMVAMESKDNKMMIKALKDILKACIFDDIDVNKLTSFDLEELFLRLRSKSVGESVNLQLKCEKCKGLTPIEINLDNIKMTELPEKKHVMVTPDIGIEFEYPSIELVSKMEYNPEKTSPDKQMKLTMQLITSCMKTIFNNDEVWDTKNQTEQELTDFIEGLNSQQFGKITEFFSSLPTLKHKIEFSCISCKHEQELTLEGVQSFFI
jgi:ribosomal protein L44E